MFSPRATFVLPMLITATLAFTPAPLRNFTQRVHHNSNNSATFQQQYQLDTTYFKPGGPILFLQGHEASTPISEIGLYTTDFTDYAAEVGAILATLEHRYFGYSFPPDFNGSIESYSALTLDNVLLDSVAFIEYVKSTVSGAHESTVIASGGSYGGFLSVMLRVRHPDIFYGTLASSPPLRNWGTPESDPYKYAYYEWMSNVYYDISAEASDKIKASMAIFYDCKTKGTCATAIPDLNLCDPQPNATDFTNLYRLTLFNYRYISQYNLPIPGVYPQSNPLQVLLNATADANTTGEVLQITHQMMNNVSVPTSTQCTKWPTETYEDRYLSMVGPSMMWITCNYVARLQDFVPENNLFPAQNGTGCLKPEFQIPSLNVNFNRSSGWWEKELGFLQTDIDSVERLLIVHGGYDGTAALGDLKLSLRSSRSQSRVIVVPGLAHTEDSYSTLVVPRGVKTQLDLVRETKKQYVIEWLAKAKANATAQI